MNSDTSEDLRIGPEILKQQAELYRRIRNTLRWILGSLDGFTESEKLAEVQFPELEQVILHRLSELNTLIETALRTHDWTGVYPAIHNFCATDLSAFYFDIRKDSLYCDRPDSEKRRACRTVLDILHRCLTAWLAPALPFTAEEAWQARFGEASSVHASLFPNIPTSWRNDILAERWQSVRDTRGAITLAIEEMRRNKTIGSSLQAVAVIPEPASAFISDLKTWSDVCITSRSVFRAVAGAEIADGAKCERCWRVLKDVGTNATHPSLCARCCEAVSP
jgi:isoleucyl-tRNA synthetase